MAWRGLAGLASAGLVIGIALATGGPASASSTGIVPTRLSSTAAGADTIGTGVDTWNQNAQLAETVPATVSASWHRNAPLCPSAAGSSATSISVSGSYAVVVENGYQCGYLTAYNLANGTVHWRRSYHFVDPAAVSAGMVYVKHDDPATGAIKLDAIVLSTGTVKWSIDANPDNEDRAVAVSGNLIADGRYTYSAKTGKPLLNLYAYITSTGTLIAGNEIVINEATDVVAFSTAGKQLWMQQKPGDGVQQPADGDATPALHGGLLYVRSTTNGATLVLSPATGTIVRTLPRSDHDIAFDGAYGFFSVDGHDYGQTDEAAGTLQAVNLSTGKPVWMFTMPVDEVTPYSLLTAPVVENGLVWVSMAATTGDSPELLALDEVTGVGRADLTGPCNEAPGNIVVARHRLFQATSCGVQTYVPTTAATPASATPGEILSDPGFEHGTGGWSALGAGTLGRVSTPTHTGSGALSVVPTSTIPGTVGFTNDTVFTGQPRLAWFRASCWIRPSVGGLQAAMQFSEWAPGSPPSTLPNGEDVASLIPGTWTKMSTEGSIQRTGDTFAPQIYVRNATRTSGTIEIDDCSVSTD